MTVLEAMQLVTSGAVEFTKGNFREVTHWHFEYKGQKYRLAQWGEIGVFVETATLPRKKLDSILLDPAHKYAETFRNYNTR